MSFTNFDVQEFLDQYWEKKPLLIKNAVPKASELATPEDLLELAQDPDFESRMIVQSGGEYPWQLKHGPFEPSSYAQDGLQTLICHKLNQLHDNFFELQKMVRFIPNWQFDDVMATLSKDGASCGAHIDNYNVFILQGQGKRKWQLQLDPDPTYVEGLDIRLLENFKPDIEYILEPGDMIYIPPKVAHHGISIGESVSYSIGFKALEYAHLLDFYTSFLMQDGLLAFYSNKNQQKSEDAFKINRQELDAIKNDLFQKIFSGQTFDDALCGFLSRPIGEVSPQSDDKADVKASFEQGVEFCRDVNSQFLYFEQKLYCNGIPFELSEQNYQQFSKVARAGLEDTFGKNDFSSDPQLVQLLLKLLLNGDLYFVD